ncbi:MAG: hypothetical protein HDQ87_04420 [Clostridia bacterium]|nr:hypothetical protein [Clostridia bacterium]
METDNSVYDLFLPVLKNYEQDPAVFSKALQITKAYEDRVDFPFNFDQMNAATAEVLGMGVHDMSQAAGLYRAGKLKTGVEDADAESRKIVEAVDPDVRSRFLRELKAFCLTLDDLMTRLYTGSIVGPPDSLERVLVLESSQEGARQVVRIIRADGAHLDLALAPKEAQFLADTLVMIAQGQAE